MSNPMAWHHDQCAIAEHAVCDLPICPCACASFVRPIDEPAELTTALLVTGGPVTPDRSFSRFRRRWTTVPAW
jgi:hypothetical protein